MTIRTLLFTRADVERQFLLINNPPETYKQNHTEVIGICPIVEFFELCELIKKGKIRANLTSFRENMQAFQDRLVKPGKVIIIDLDQNRLVNSLFEWNDDHIVTGLWSPAANRKISPTHSVRRLLLRPSDQNWWDGDIYAAAEAIYRSIEEL
jgi:hypothetical protein